jgi:hypothetical protein
MPINTRQILSVIVFVTLSLAAASAAERGNGQQGTNASDRKLVERPVASAKKAVSKTIQPIQIPLHVAAQGITPWVASYQNTIYIVYANANKIYLVSSGDGISWSSPRLISGNDVASAPAILLLDSGTKVITWITGITSSVGIGQLRYYLEDSCNSPTGPVTIANYIVRYDITRTDDQIHVVIEDPYSIEYATFPSAVPPTSINETIATVPLCFDNTYARYPAIAARSTPSGPDVAVAYYHYSDEPSTTCNAPPHLAGFYVFKRTSPGQWSGFGGTATQIDPNATTKPDAYSMSLAVDSGGVYFAAASYLINSVSQVILARGNYPVGMQNDTMNYQANIARTVNVAKSQNQPYNFNLASSKLLLPANYGATDRQVAGWPPWSPAPFFGGAQGLDASGRNARAADIRVCKGASLCILSTVFERKLGTNPAEIVTDSVCVPSPACAATSGSQATVGGTC